MGRIASRHACAVLAVALLLPCAAAGAEGPAPAVDVTAPPVALRGVPFDVQVRPTDFLEAPVSLEASWVPAHGEPTEGVRAELRPGESSVRLEMTLPRTGRGELFVTADGWDFSQPLRCIPGFASLLPPLLAIALALWLRTVIPALFAGVWLGAILVSGYDPWTGLLRTVDTYLLGALADSDHASIVIFSLMLGGMVGVMSRCGGTAGIVRALAPLARSRRSAQVATWAMGLVIFFDDYANSLIVGNTMRPVTDRLRVSREKLAYIVDATAAPVASLAVISTWIGFEVGLIGDAFTASGYHGNAYLAFLGSLPYRYYPILALWTVLLVAWTGRDIGPMARAEIRAAGTGRLLEDGAQPLADAEAAGMAMKEGIEPRWWNAVVPIGVVIVASFVGLWTTGRAGVEPGAGLWEVFGKADPFKSLLWGSLLGVLTAIALSLGQRLLTLSQALEAWLTGIKAMSLAVVVLLLAWSIGQVTTEHLHADRYLSGILTGTLDPRLLPALTFVLAATISFATGTSWGTMGILLPLVIPVSLQMTLGSAALDDWHYLMGTISSVLAGAVFGDHCSPLSDTTILSSMASACDHMDHVRTQLPYALLVGGVGLVLGDLGTSFFPFTASPYVALLLGAAVLAGIVFWFGRGPRDPGRAPEEGA